MYSSNSAGTYGDNLLAAEMYALEKPEMLMLESPEQEEGYTSDSTYRRILGSSGSNPSAGDSCVWCTWSTCLASSRSLSISARSKINQRRSNLERRAGGRFMFSAGVLRKSYLPLHKTHICINLITDN